MTYGQLLSSFNSEVTFSVPLEDINWSGEFEEWDLDSFAPEGVKDRVAREGSLYLRFEGSRGTLISPLMTNPTWKDVVDFHEHAMNQTEDGHYFLEGLTLLSDEQIKKMGLDYPVYDIIAGS